LALTLLGALAKGKFPTQKKPRICGAFFLPIEKMSGLLLNKIAVKLQYLITVQLAYLHWALTQPIC
jgi:hypothetical protein